jgi:hypothetical protein
MERKNTKLLLICFLITLAVSGLALGFALRVVLTGISNLIVNGCPLC